jgi:Zn-dependent peptidase ImmA (M78 family)
LHEFRAKRRELVSAVGEPWDVGYQQARAIRGQIEPDATARLAVDRYVLSRSRQAPDVSLQALGGSADQLRPLVIVGQRRPVTSNRFTLSRALWHCIWDDSPLFIVTTAHTHRQRVERAFASEFLAPADGIAALLESPPEAASQEELEQIAQRFGVSSMVIEHQVRNHLIAA